MGKRHRKFKKEGSRWEGSKYNSKCDGKSRFRDQEEAKRSAFAVLQRCGRQLRTYQCPLCGGWHLTSREDRYDRDLKD